MIDSIFSFPSVRLRQKEAPLLRERELYLSHLLQQGCAPQRVRSIATALLQVVRLMELQNLREIQPAEIRIASARRVHDTPLYLTRQLSPSSATTFYQAAKRWFRFHKVLIIPPPEKKPYDNLLGQFVDAMQNSRGKFEGGIGGHPSISALMREIRM